MKNHFYYFLIAVFAVFLGSQITEGVLLVPYWQSLSVAEFYRYYQDFGPLVNQFYTVLTIVALVIPIGLSVYYYRIKSPGLRFALVSALFAVLFVACFYIYFKETNGLFYQSTMDANELKTELIIWSRWHWSRVVLEATSLFFLMLSVAKEE